MKTFRKMRSLQKRAIEKHGTPKLQELMDTSGFGNHPEIFKFFAKIGKMMSDDEFVIPGAQGGVTETTTDILYPSMKKN